MRCIRLHFDPTNWNGIKNHLSFVNSIFTKFIAFLEKAGVGYCVLGDARAYPARIMSDVDFTFDSNSLANVDRLLIEFCEQNRVFLIERRRDEPEAYLYTIAWYDMQGMLCWFRPDICGDYFRNGRRLSASSSFPFRRERARGDDGGARDFFVPSPEQEFQYYLVKKIAKEALSEAQGAHLSEEWAKSPEACFAQTCGMFPERERALIKTAAETNCWGGIQVSIAHMKRVLFKKLDWSARAMVGKLRCRIRSVCQPHGFFMALMGPDGSGKSSVIAGATRELAPFFPDILCFHLRPQLGCPVSDVTVIDPHASENRRFFMSTVKLCYWLFDYIVGYMVKILPFLLRSRLVVFDRYFYDLLVDPKRYRYGGSMKWVRACFHLVPTPDLVLMLDGNAGIFQGRKREVSFSETERQIGQYRALNLALDRAEIIDASQPLEVVVRSVLLLVFGAM
ncbi:MAG: hypothetical protein ACOYM3_20920, partial [Terrimicrobiaceae bacterium]